LDAESSVPEPLVFFPSLSALPMALVAAVMLILGIAVVARERLSAVSAAFFLLALSISIWLASISAMGVTRDPAMALWLARGAYIGVCAIPAAIFTFSLALVQEARRRAAAVAASWVIAAFFTALFIRTDALLTGVWRYSWGFYPRLSLASLAFIGWFGFMLAASLYTLSSAQTRGDVSERQRARIRAFWWALAVGYLGSVDYVPAFGVSMYPLGFLFIAAFMVLAARAVSRFRLVDINSSFVADQLLQTVHGAVLVVDLQGNIRLANPLAAQILGYGADGLEGANLTRLLGLTELPATDSNTLARRGRTKERVMMWKRRDGRFVELAVSAALLRDLDQVPVGILYVARDLADQRRAERVEFQATHDALTGLPNLNFVRSNFPEMVRQIGEMGRVPALLFIDLDGFKEVNDRYGHASGDMLLQFVGARLANAVREGDLVARVGGDEFIMLVSLRQPEDAAIVAQKVVRVVGDVYALDDVNTTISASVGAAVAAEAMAIDTLIKAADTAMYEAKHAGKNRYRVYGAPPPPAAATTPSIVPRRDVPAPPPFRFEERA
jgi:diguanylate cyclase (GGDEF)-like protein/PAS domain S-box-containing protein